MPWSDDQFVVAISQHVLPFCRIAALLMVAPVFGANIVPARIKVIMALGFSALIVPMLPASDITQFPSTILILQEILVGAAIGFVVQIVFDATVLGGQTAAMSMGLGFAFFFDQQRGINVPIVSQFFLIITTLVFLSLDGHLVLISVLAESFTTLPVGGGGLDETGIKGVIAQGTILFGGAVKIALPAIIAVLATNIAFGVVSRAAPTLNLFSVGFPVSMLMGFMVLMYNFNNLGPNLTLLFENAFHSVRALVGLP